MATTPESEPHLPPAPSGVRYLASIKGVGHPSSVSVEEPLEDYLPGSRLHHALLTTCQRLDLTSLRPWAGTKELRSKLIDE